MALLAPRGCGCANRIPREAEGIWRAMRLMTGKAEDAILAGIDDLSGGEVRGTAINKAKARGTGKSRARAILPVRRVRGPSTSPPGRWN